MRRLILCIVVCCAILLPALAQAAYDVLIIQTRRDIGYVQALKGFRSARDFTVRFIDLSEYSGWDIPGLVRDDKPLMVLAIGDKALEATRGVRTVPVIGLMSLALHDKRQMRPNLSGVGMFAPPDEYLRIIGKLRKHRVGVVHDPNRSGWYLRQARAVAEAAGIELVVREVSSPRDTLDRLASMAGKVDALWMLPDLTAVTRDTSEAYFRFAQQHRLPLISFSSAYLGLGAAAVLELDRYGMGAQAGAMAVAIINGSRSAASTIEPPRNARVMPNTTVLNNLGFSSTILNDLLSALLLTDRTVRYSGE